jgi:hypothetical protein
VSTKKPPVPGELLALAAGARLFEKGSPSDSVYFVKSGELELLGEGDSCVATLRAGDPVGELDAIAGLPHTHSARAVSSSTLMAVDRDTLLAVLAAHPEVGVAMMRRLAPRFAGAATAPPAPAAPSAPVASPAPAAPVRPRLVHAETGVELPLPDKAEISVGRGGPRSRQPADLDLTVVDASRSASRRHAWLLRDADELYVREEPGAANGTYVNGTRLATTDRVLVRPGDEVRFGHAALVYRVDAG